MKKILAFLLALSMVFSLSACGGSTQSSDTPTDITTAPVITEPADIPDTEGDISDDDAAAIDLSAIDVFTQIWNSLSEDQKPMSFGGDYNEENQVENAPGKHDIGDGTELDSGFGFPTDMVDQVKEAATIRHMLNVNQLSAALYKMTDGADISSFAQGIRDSLMNRSYMCGWPEVLVVLNIGDKYILSAYGNTDLVYALRDAASAYAYPDGTVPSFDILFDESMENAAGDNTFYMEVPELG